MKHSKYIHRSWMIKIALVILITVTILWGRHVTVANAAGSTEVALRENILIIHSYNQGFSWTDELHRGITEDLSDIKYNIYTEYLDAYRENPLDLNTVEKIKSYASKDIATIVVTDNTAYELIISLKPEYFPDTPVLFAGVNGGMPADMKFDDVKGILQNVGYEAFFLWLDTAMPQIKDLLICGADTNTTKGTYEQMVQAYDKLADHQLDFKMHLIKIDDYGEQLNEISSYDAASTALYSAGSFGVLNHDQYTDMLSVNSNMPTFCGVSTSITNKVIGGFVVSPYEHGHIIGEDILALSAGRSIESMSIIEEPVQQKIFNHNGMLAFALSESMLPANSKVINKPEGNFILTLNQVILISFILILMAVIISALLLIMTIRRKTHLALAQANNELYNRKIELEEKSEKLIESQEELTNNYNLLINANQKISNLLNYNQLTGTLSEIRFNKLLETAFLAEKEITILNITITNLNELTYSHGKETYGAMLKNIADFLRSITEESDLIGLSSNNDFLIATTGIRVEESELIRQISYYFEKPLDLDLFTVIIKYKIGIAYYPAQTNSYPELLQLSRLAITPIINNVLKNVSVYNQSIMAKIHHENCIKNEIETALEAKEFVLYYQPKYAIDGFTMLGLEALIRWQYRDGSVKSPGYFIDIAEQSGQIINIGFYVIERVCQSIVEYGLVEKEIPVAINLSGQHFASRDIVYKLQDAVSRYHIPSHLLEIEITETAIIQNKEFGAAILSELRTLGFIVTLDDFGTGYASIDYIKNLPIDRLKIDQSYARRLEDIKSRKLLKTMIQMAHELSFEVTVEGVETQEQFEIIKAFEPKELQGYYFKRPVPLNEIFNKKE